MKRRLRMNNEEEEEKKEGFKMKWKINSDERMKKECREIVGI